MARAADAVCVSTSSEGLVCLTEQGFKPYSRKTGHLPDDRVADLAVCGDKIHVAVGEAVVGFDGANFDRVVRVGRGLVERVACAEDGSLWAASQTAVSYRPKDGEWRHYDLATVLGGAARTARVRGLAAGRNGAMWATIGEGMVLHYSGRDWRIFRPGQGFRARHNFGRIAADRAGNVWLPYAQGLYTWKAERWEPVRGLIAANFISIDEKNRLLMTSGARVAVIEAGRMREIPIDYNTRAVAADSTGAVWAATDFGIARYTGTAWETRQMHNSQLPDNDLMLIAVLGSGAQLPAAAVKARGALAGRAQWSDGAPIADADVQVCGVRAYDFGEGKGPCDDKPLAAKAVTDKAGAFDFRNLPSGNYHFVIRPKGAKRWIRFATDPDRLKVLPGEAKLSGNIAIDAKQRDPR